MDEHIPRKEIAEDILEFCKKNKKRFFVVRYAVGKIMCAKRKEPYTPCELAQGIRYVRERRAMVRVSNYRWRIESYELKDSWEDVLKAAGRTDEQIRAIKDFGRLAKAMENGKPIDQLIEKLADKYRAEGEK
jgi:hypothetical protein